MVFPPLLSMPPIRPRRLFRSPMIDPANSSGTVISTFITGSRSVGFATSIAFLNEILGNCAAENIVDELELPSTWQRLHFDFAITVLAVAAGLLLVPALDVGLAATGLAIRDLGRLQGRFSVVALLY